MALTNIEKYVAAVALSKMVIQYSENYTTAQITEVGDLLDKAGCRQVEGTTLPTKDVVEATMNLMRLFAAPGESDS